MRTGRAARAIMLALLSVTVGSGPAQGRTLLGLGPASRSCLIALEWDASGGTERVVRGQRPTTVLECTDGDPTCDSDGVRDGACVFRIGVCLNVATEPCRPRLFRRIRATAKSRAGRLRLTDGLPFPIEVAEPICGAVQDFTVPVRGKFQNKPGRGPVRIRVRSVPSDSPGTDRDRFKFLCHPPGS